VVLKHEVSMSVRSELISCYVQDTIWEGTYKQDVNIIPYGEMTVMPGSDASQQARHSATCLM
jgi:hypothetical protein